MRVNKKINHGRSKNWCSQDGMNHCSGKIKMRAYRRSIPSSPPLNFTNFMDSDPSDITTTLKIIGIAIGSIMLIIIICCLVLFIRKRNFSRSQKDEEEEGGGEVDFPKNPRELTINFVRHNHAIPELCTTPDTQPILDYYSSKAGLTNTTSSVPVNNYYSKNDDDRKSIPVEVSESIKKSSEENINNKEYIPQYYNGMEIPPLGARIIPLERQAQIAKEFTSSDLSPANNNNNNKRKSNRSISSILSISSRRRSSSTTNTNTNNNHFNNSSSTTNTLSLIRETPRKDDD